MANHDVSPYAVLDRALSRRVATTPSGDALQVIMARSAEAPPYDELINYPRAKDKDEIRCVMCGLPPGMQCVIPRQNKDVCKDCDKSTWKHNSSNVYFKWCKGCKKFLRLGSFSEKIDAAKCDRCRERGRQSYLVKKGKDGNVEVCAMGNRSRSNSVSSMKSDFEAELAGTMTLVSAAAAIASAAHTPSDTRARVSSSLSNDGNFRGHYSDHCSDGDENEEDTIMSARAVASLSKLAYPSVSPFDALTPEPDEPAVLIDDETADVATSKLSSVFGKPLRELKRAQAPLPAPEGLDSDSATDGSVEADGQSSDSEATEGGAVTSALRGTLYELACIHQRIVTLEEHAARVKRLEAKIETQNQTIAALRADAARLREDLVSAKFREEASQGEVVSLRSACATLKEAAGVKRDHEVTEATDLPTGVAGEMVCAAGSFEAFVSAMEKVQKRPRLVSLGD